MLGRIQGLAREVKRRLTLYPQAQSLIELLLDGSVVQARELGAQARQVCIQARALFGQAPDSLLRIGDALR